MIGTEIQKAIYEALIAGPPIARGGIHDRVPEGTEFPYLTIGDETSTDDGTSCGEGWEVTSEVHIWSRDVGYGETKRIAAQAVPRLKAIASIENHRLVDLTVERAAVFRDPDGVTSHGVITVSFIITPA